MARPKKEIIVGDRLEEKILQNLVELQKVHTNLAEKFDKLSVQIANLLSLFEMTARNFAHSPGIKATEKDKEFLDKVDRLLEQNKTIAKGLVLVEQSMRERIYGGRQKEEVRTETVEHVSEPIEREMPSLPPTAREFPKPMRPLPRL